MMKRRKNCESLLFCLQPIPATGLFPGSIDRRFGPPESGFDLRQPETQRERLLQRLSPRDTEKERKREKIMNDPRRNVFMHTDSCHMVARSIQSEW